MVPETKYAKSGNVHIAYQLTGEGPVDLVFVRGWISHIEHLWEEPSLPVFLIVSHPSFPLTRDRFESRAFQLGLASVLIGCAICKWSILITLSIDTFSQN